MNPFLRRHRNPPRVEATGRAQASRRQPTRQPTPLGASRSSKRSRSQIAGRLRPPQRQPRPAAGPAPPPPRPQRSVPARATAPSARTGAGERGGEGQPSATTFRDYGRLDFVEAYRDNVSTFSLDTDRTSFQLALGWAKDGYEIDPLSVRAEEWINSFDYQYQMPQDGGSFAITTDLFRHPLDSRMNMARIGLQAPIVLDATPLNVTLVLDASGSMREGNRVDIARAAAESIRDSLDSHDRIAVVPLHTGCQA